MNNLIANANLRTNLTANSSIGLGLKKLKRQR